MNCFKYDLNSEELQQVKNYCSKEYDKRRVRDILNNDNGKNRMQDNILGKIGEVACAACYDVKVNWDIFETNEYKPEKDLYGNNTDQNLFVKTSSAEYSESRAGKRGGTVYSNISFVVDKKRDPIMNDPEENYVVILAYANLEGEVYVLGHINAKKLQEPGQKYYKPTDYLPHKSALYLKDIFHLIELPPKINCVFPLFNNQGE